MICLQISISGAPPRDCKGGWGAQGQHPALGGQQPLPSPPPEGVGRAPCLQALIRPAGGGRTIPKHTEASAAKMPSAGPAALGSSGPVSPAVTVPSVTSNSCCQRPWLGKGGGLSLPGRLRSACTLSRGLEPCLSAWVPPTRVPATAPWWPQSGRPATPH